MTLEDEEPDWELLEQRIIQKYNEGLIPEAYSFTVGGRKLTPDQIVDQVQRRTSTGVQIMLIEQKFLEESAKRER